jgi:restriction endonuclease S subunit
MFLGGIGIFICIHDGWLLFRPINDNATKDYLHTILGSNFIYKLFKKQTIGGVVENLNIDLVKDIKIPIPPKNIQDEIVAKMDVAYQNKQNKEVKAKKLLNSIDTYLLGELEIELPKQTDNSLKARIFIKRLSDIARGRFDPNFHLIGTNDISEKYELYQLKLLVNIKKGNSITKENIVNGNIPVIAGGQTSPYNHNIANYQSDVITVSASGAYAGYVWYHDYPIFASDCTVISSQINTNISVKYIYEYLKLKQQYIYNLQQGAAQPHIYPSDLEKLNIPLPPLEKQNQIAKHISQIREQAKQLQLDAKTGLEKAKQEVETMILGSEV